MLVEFERISDAPPYTCISYDWGHDKTEHLLNDHRLMSARTIPVIETAIRVSRAQENWANNVQFSYDRDSEKEEAGRAAALKASQAFWIDALCVPLRDPSRSACLQSMGEIFNSASQVFAVLAEVCSEMLHQMHNFGRLDHSALFILESDDWITRAWTYQETVNSKALYFMAENNEISLISGLDFLNVVLTATDDYQNAHEMDSFAWSE